MIQSLAKREEEERRKDREETREMENLFGDQDGHLCSSNHTLAAGAHKGMLVLLSNSEGHGSTGFQFHGFGGGERRMK